VTLTINYQDLNRIGTRPEYQGKGAARELMKWGTDQADRQGKCCILSTDLEVSVKLLSARTRITY